MTDEKTLRRKLQNRLRERGAQARLADALEVHASTVGRWADGSRIPPLARRALGAVLDAKPNAEIEI